MIVLLVEDDQNKQSQISSHIHNLMPDAEIVLRYSYQSGMEALINSSFDLVVLDMSMPTFDITPNEPGGRPRIYGGKEIVRQMSRRNIISPVIVITQFETFGEMGRRVALSELHEELISNYPTIYRGFVYYNAAVDSWKKDFNDILQAVLEQ